MYPVCISKAKFARIVLYLIFLVVFSACATFLKYPLDTRTDVNVGDSGIKIVVDYNGEYYRDAELISRCVNDSLPKFEKWGGLKHSVKIKLYATHGDLETSIGKHGYPWLRAWAKFDEVHFQTPYAWNAYDVEDRVCEVVTHELTHVVMYQQIGDKSNWYKKAIPLWFREGMASYVAGQGHRRLSRGKIKEYMKSYNLSGDPAIEGEKIIKKHPKVVYSASHWKFVDLVEQYGEQRIVSLLRLIGKGDSFKSAWKQMFGSNSSSGKN